MATCKIKKVKTRKAGSRPFLVNFETGILTQKECDKFQCEGYINQETKQQTAVIKVNGKLWKGVSEANELCQTFLLIRDKTTKKGKLVALAPCMMTKPTKQSTSSTSRPSSSFEARADLIRLTKAFGSKKSQRQSDIGVRIANSSKGNLEEIEHTVNDISVTEDDISQQPREESLTILKIIPPCHREATSIEEVYRISDLLTAEESESLRSPAEMLILSPPKMDGQTSELLYSALVKLNKQADVERIKLILYCDSLWNFYKLTVKEIYAKKGLPSKVCPYSIAVGKRIIRDFSVESKTGRTRPYYMKDKVIAHIAVGFLLAFNYKIDSKWLLDCLIGLGAQKLRLILKAVGLTSQGVGGVFTLKLPLPPLPTAPKKKK